MTRAAVLAGVGSALPEPRNNRADPSRPAVAAGARALTGRLAGCTDTVMVTSTTPDLTQAPGAAEVAGGLGLTDTAAFDWPPAEDAFLVALAEAAALIECGWSDCAVVIGTGEFAGRPGARASAGVGAGALVLRAGNPEEPGALGPFELAGGGDDHLHAAVPAPGVARLQPVGSPGPHHGSRPRPESSRVGPETSRVGPRSARFGPETSPVGPEGSRVFWRTVQRLGQAAQAVLDRAGWTADDVDKLMVSQENRMTTRRLADELGIPTARGLSAVAAAGHAESASFPLALDRARATGALSPGDRVLLAACHGDPAETWGATVLTWPQLDSG